MSGIPIIPEIKLTADLTKSSERIVDTICNYFDIPYRLISKSGEVLELVFNPAMERQKNKTLSIQTEGQIRRDMMYVDLMSQKQNTNIGQIIASSIDDSQQNPSNINDGADIDETWLNTFFDSAKNISDREIQIIWARILSSKITQSSSFSIRTLNTLKQLDTDEAQIFANLAKYTFYAKKDKFIVYDSVKQQKDLYQSIYGIDQWLLKSLDEAGLLKRSPGAIIFKGIPKEEITYHQSYGDIKFKFCTKSSTNSFERHVSVIWLTKVGNEIADLIEHDTDPKNINRICHFAGSDKDIQIRF